MFWGERARGHKPLPPPPNPHPQPFMGGWDGSLTGGPGGLRSPPFSRVSYHAPSNITAQTSPALFLASERLDLTGFCKNAETRILPFVHNFEHGKGGSALHDPSHFIEYSRDKEDDRSHFACQKEPVERAREHRELLSCPDVCKPDTIVPAGWLWLRRLGQPVRCDFPGGF
jgi:hypothetical protein